MSGHVQEISESMLDITVTINGTAHSRSVEVRRSLADFIREDAGLTGTHLGCEHGVCGACTVVVDGKASRSCLMLAVQADGTEITTIEGLATDDQLHPIQQALHESHGFQCAFCAPGFLMTTLCLLEENPTPTRDQIREEISGNLCRCTGYHSIIEGIETAVTLMASSEVSSVPRTYDKEMSSVPRTHDDSGVTNA